MEPISDKFELDDRISQLREYAEDKLCRSAALEWLNFMVKDALADLQGPNLDVARSFGDLDDGLGAGHVLQDYPALATEEIAAADLLLSLYSAIAEAKSDHPGERLLSYELLYDIERKFNSLLAWRLFGVKVVTDRATDSRSRKQRKEMQERNESRGLPKRNEQIFAWYKEIVSTGGHWYMKTLQSRILTEGRKHGFSDGDLTLCEKQLRTIIKEQKALTKKKVVPTKKMRKSGS